MQLVQTNEAAHVSQLSSVMPKLNCDVNAETASDVPLLPNRYPRTPMTSFPMYR